ncbi:MAG: hypothetical protein ACYDGW_09070 [Vulcanimicrobiaceae bacterium]
MQTGTKGASRMEFPRKLPKHRLMVPDHAIIESLFAELRDAERVAGERLEAGCADDAKAIETFFRQPLESARREAIDAISGMGKNLEADLAAHLRREAFVRIASRFAEQIRANAGMRARARFKRYAQELANAEARIAEAIAASRTTRAKRLFPRMFTIHYLDFDDLHFPDAPSDDSEEEIEAWIERLRRCVRDLLTAQVDSEREHVLACGIERLGIVSARMHLALHAHQRAAGLRATKMRS